MTATCSAVIQRSLLVKMQDPIGFTIPCTIGNVEFKKVLCDSGAIINLMLIRATVSVPESTKFIS